MKIVFQKESNTLRQMPENYLVAYFHPERNHWVMDQDLACDFKIASSVFKLLHKHENKYEKDGSQLVMKIQGLNATN